MKSSFVHSVRLLINFNLKQTQIFFLRRGPNLLIPLQMLSAVEQSGSM